MERPRYGRRELRVVFFTGAPMKSIVPSFGVVRASADVGVSCVGCTRFGVPRCSVLVADLDGIAGRVDALQVGVGV